MREIITIPQTDYESPFVLKRFVRKISILGVKVSIYSPDCSLKLDDRKYYLRVGNILEFPDPVYVERVVVKTLYQGSEYGSEATLFVESE